MLTENFRDADEFKQLSMVDQAAVIEFWAKRERLQGTFYQKAADVRYQIPVFSDLCKVADRFAPKIGLWAADRFEDARDLGIEARRTTRIHELQKQGVLPNNLCY